MSTRLYRCFKSLKCERKGLVVAVAARLLPVAAAKNGVQAPCVYNMATSSQLSCLFYRHFINVFKFSLRKSNPNKNTYISSEVLFRLTYDIVVWCLMAFVQCRAPVVNDATSAAHDYFNFGIPELDCHLQTTKHFSLYG